MIARLSTLAGATLVTFTTEPTGAGPLYKLRDLRGWLNSGYRPNVDETEGDGGLGPKTLFRGSKVMAIEGVIYGGTTAAAAAAWQAIAALPATPIVLTVDDTTEVQKRMVVWINGPIEVDPLRNNVARVFIPVTAADPRKYSTALDTLSYPLSTGTGSVQASFTNEGTAPAPIIGRISSGSVPLSRLPIKWDRVGDPNAWFDYGSDATGSEGGNVTFTYDFGGIALAGLGLLASGTLRVGTAGWPTVLPGNTVNMRITVPAGSASTMTVYLDFRSAWY